LRRDVLADVDELSADLVSGAERSADNLTDAQIARDLSSTSRSAPIRANPGAVDIHELIAADDLLARGGPGEHQRTDRDQDAARDGVVHHEPTSIARGIEPY
jgi:hypothetical protein